MKWICCAKHSHPSNASLPFTNPHYIRTCTFQGCDHQRCSKCTLPLIEDWYSSQAPTSPSPGENKDAVISGGELNGYSAGK